MSEPELRVRVLGTVEVDGVTVGSQLGRTLLALLALAPGRSTSTAALIDGLWDEALPRHPATALQVQVTRLRKRFAEAGADGTAGRAGTPVVSTRGGYVLRLGPGTTDLACFHRAVDEAVAAGDPPTAAARARDALALWGEPFAGCVPASRLEVERRRAEDRMLRAVEVLARAELDLGAPGAAADIVLPHLADHRGREGLAALAMSALHRSGRTVEALGVLAETRRYLRREHGVDAGEELRALEGELLSARGPAGPAPGRPVVGRDDLLAVLRARLDDPGAGGVVVVRGEAGIGKTSLLRAAREEAAQRGGWTGGGVWDADGEPLTAWVEALRELGVTPPVRGDPEPVLTLRRRLAERAADAPVLLTLDDAHRADSASRGVLRSLARRGLPAGVVVVVAVRAPDVLEHPKWDDTHADLLRHPSVTELPLAGLDSEAVVAVVDRRLAAFDDDVRARLGEVLWRRSAGHPLHLDALLDAVVSGADEDGVDEEQALAVTGEVPGRLRVLLAHQLERLPDACREVLEALAVLAPVRLDDLADVLGRDARSAAAALRPAVEVALVEPVAQGYTFRHELTALAARERVPHPERATLHRARFEGLDGAGDPFEWLRHAVGAADLLDPAVVADVRLAAGVAARAKGALEEALALFEAAGEQGSDPCAAVVARGLVLEALGRAEESDDVLDAVVAEPGVAVVQAVDAAVGTDAMGIAVTGRPRRLARLSRVRELPLSDAQRARVLRAAIVEQDQLLGGGGDDLLPELLALVDDGRVADPRVRVQVGLLRGNRLADEPVGAAARVLHGEQVHALAVRTGEPALRMEAEELLVAALIAAGRVADAEAIVARLAVEARRRRHARSIWACGMVRASLLLARGDDVAATAAAEATMQRGVDLGIPDAAGAYGVHCTVVHLLAGTLPALGGLPAAAAHLYPHVAAWPGWAAVDAVHAGDRDAAATHLAEFRRRREGREHRMFDRPGLCAAALAAAALGDAGVARAVLDDLPPDPDAVVVVGIGAGILGPLDLYRGLALRALGEHDAAHTAFVAAADLAALLGWKPWTEAADRLAREDDDLPLGLRTLPGPGGNARTSV